MKLHQFFTVFILSIFLFACKNNNDKSPENRLREVSEEHKKVVFPIPTPYSVTNVLKEADADFYEYLLNSINNAEAYITLEKQGLNLGVYGTDLSYANVYGNSQLVNEYFSVIKYLTDELGFTELFNKEFLLRIQNNIDKPDSLFKIATESTYKTYEYLINRGKGDLATIVLVGSWIEGLFLATQIGNLSEKPEVIWPEIAQQKFSSVILVEQLEKFKRSSNLVDDSYQNMKKLDMLLRQIKFKDDKPVYDAKLFNELSISVAQIRSKIVNP